MKNGWYILNYHNISWEDSDLTKGIGGNFPPDIFREHLDYLNQNGELVSIQEGFNQFKNSNIKKPLISIWFDDGYAGIRKYAFPILESYNVKAGLSINSRFLLNQELFWRSKLSFLSQVDGLRFLRTKLRKYGYKNSMIIKDFVMNKFCDEIIEDINNVYNRFTKQDYRKDAFRIFDNFEGVNELLKNGWEIANHSASHYPSSEKSYIHKFEDEFIECEKAIEEFLKIETRFWVLPFDRANHRDSRVTEVFNKLNQKNRHLVFVGDKINMKYNADDRVINRAYVPEIGGKELIRKLKSLPIY